MNLVDVLKQLQEKNISLSLENGQLKVNAAKGAMTKELMGLLKANKDELLDWATQQQHKSQANKSIEKRIAGEPLKLSFSQQRLWFVEQLAPGNATYNVPAAIILKGELQTDILQQVMTLLTQRHEALRTYFIDNNGEAEQRIVEHIDITLEIESCELSLSDEKDLLTLASQELLKPFDLSQAPLFRLRLLRLGGESSPVHLLLLNLHHIITDGWSNGILLNEIAQCYGALVTGKNVDLPNIPIQYADYAQWQQQQLSPEQLHNKTLWWKTQLAELESLELPIDKARPAQKSGRGAMVHFSANAQVKDALSALAKTQGCTTFIALFSAYQILLSRLTGQTDICIGTPTANRQRAEVQNTLGFFVNTLSLRNQLDDEISFNQLLTASNTVFMQANEHQDVPFETIVDSLGLSREMSSTPIFQTMISYQKDDLQTSFSIDALTIEALDIETHTAKFDLTLGISEKNSGFEFSFEYDSDIFNETSIQYFGEYFLQLLNSIVSAPHKNIHQLDILSSDKKTQLIQQGQGPKTDANADVHLAHQIEQWAINTPDAIALEFNHEKISYGELNSRASQYAFYLQEQGFNKGDILALTLQRSHEMVVAIFAALKLGGVYLPIDPNYPDDRISYMLEDSAAKIVICRQEQSLRLTTLQIKQSSLICIEDLVSASAKLNTDWITDANNKQGQDLAYIMYTSGSTGQPKGVMIPQSGVSRLALNTNMGSTDVNSRIAHLSNVAFDAAALEIWTALLNGACLVGVDQDDLLDAKRFGEFIQENDISFLLLTVALFNVFVSENPAIFSGIDYVFAGGEAVDISKINAVINASNSIGESASPKHLINAYGPTENSCISSFYRIDKIHTSTIPIGIPLSNSLCYILDKNGQLCPTGVSGELCVAGEGVAAGYLNKPEQTAAAFINNPFLEDSLLYKTGDVCRWNHQGEIEIIGRIDEQVKLRGYRIELDEISKQLGLIDQVKEAVVIVRNQGENKYLAAYIVCDDAIKNSEDSALTFIQAIKSTLSHQLPLYMVPQAFELMTKLPINANGKLNKKALPEPSFSLVSTQEYIGARNPFETAISDVWLDILGLEKISVLDNFFEIGGHSLLATRVVAQLRQRFSVELQLRELFDNPSIAELALRLQVLQGQQQRLPKLTAIKKEDRPNKIPLSYSQQRLWFIEQLNPGSSLYNMPFALKLHGKLNIEALQRAFEQLINRHEILRSRIVSEKGVAWQEVDEKTTSSCAFYEVDDDEQDIINRASEFLLKPFSLGHEHLLRAELLQQRSSGDFVLLVAMHHIISDAWSMDIFIRELLSFYQANCNDIDAPLPTLTAQYADYAIWQRDYLAGEVLDSQIDYWTQQLAYSEALELPLDYSRPAVLDNAGKQYHFKLPLSLSRQLRTLSQQQGTSLYMTLLAAFQILLAKYSNQSDISVGSPIANRPVAELENMMGLFLNTLVLRSEVDPQTSFNDFLQQVKNTTLDAYQHQDIPFEIIVDEMNVIRDTSQTPLFQVMFILQSSSQASSAKLTDTVIDGLKISSLGDDQQAQTAKFDITLNIIDTEDQLSAAIEYRSSLFSDATIQRLATHFMRLLDSITETPQQNIGDLQFITDAEIDQQMDFEKGFNATAHHYKKCSAVHHLIEQQAANTPDATAVIYNDTTLSYQSLNEKSNQLAHHLVKSGLQVGDAVGLCLYRSEQMSVALLAILKAGGAYVPFDPDFPIERLNFMADDTAIKILISDNNVAQHANINVSHTVLMSDYSAWSDADNHNINIEFGTAALFNIIYTSGSTGQPKGVMVPHSGIINRLRWMQDTYPIAVGDNILQKTPYSFDVSVWELFWPLMQGSTLVFAEKDGHKDPRYLRDIINQHRISTLHFVPSMLGLFLQTDEIENCTSIRQVFCSGEALQLEHGRQFYQRIPHAQLHNLYGPTEASIDVSYYHCLKNENRRSIPIGKAIHNIQLHILDGNLNIAPQGVAGDLYIGGAGLALGYLNRHELTRDTFIDNPFVESHQHPSKKLYKTGDVARFLHDGNIEYLGRSDHQIKIRGLRIELGEIESRLQQLNDVREAIVVAASPDDNESNTQLIAYCLFQTDFIEAGCDTGSIIQTLKKDLPDYMLPSQFIGLHEWPLSANGKINRKALPQPQWNTDSENYSPPENDLQQQLVDIWLTLLPATKIGINDNFFEIGGHSLLATRLSAEIARSFDIELSINHIFESPTVKTLAQSIENTDLHCAALPPILAVDRNQKLPLSFNQQRLWFIYKLQPSAASYNMPTALRLTGTLNISAFEKSVNAILKRHEILRSRFIEEGEDVYQQSIEPALYQATIENIDSSDSLQQIIDREAQAPFDLACDNLLRIRLLQKTDKTDELTLLVTMHHIISDAVSLQNMVKELALAYYSFSKNTPLLLPALPVQYADYAWWQKNVLQGDYLNQQLSYWQENLQGIPALLNLPTDKPRPSEQSHNGRIFSSALSGDTVQRLRKFSKQHHYTPFMILLGAQQLLLARLANENDICIGVPIAGRHQKGTEDLLGFFVNALVIRSQFDHNPSVGDYFQQIKTSVLSAFAHQDVPFEQIIENCKIARSPAYNPVAQVGFNYITQQQNILQQLSNELGDLKIESLDQEFTDAKYDMIWAFLDTLDDGENGSIQINLEYNTDLFENDTIEQWFNLYEQLVNNMLDEVDAPVLKISLTNSEHLLQTVQSKHLHPESIASVRPLTAMQRDLYLDSVLNPDNRRNYFGWIQRIDHQLDVEKFQQAIDVITAQFSSLRMRIIEPDMAHLELAYAAIVDPAHATAKITVPHLDWSNDNLTTSEFNRRCKEELAFKSYDLANEPIIRFIAIKETAHRYAIVLTAHHSCIDGISLQTVTTAYTDVYQALINNSSYQLVEDNYAHYVHQQHYQCDNQASLTLWKNQAQSIEALKSSSTPLNAHKAKGEYFFKEYSDDPLHLSAIKKYCKENKTTEFLYMKALYSLMLQSYCYADDSFYFTDVIAARPKGQLQETGCYFEQRPTVIHKNALLGDNSFLDLLDYLNQQRIAVRGDNHISNSMQNRLFSQSNTQFLFNFYLTERYLPFLDGQSETTFIVPEMDDAVTFTAIVDDDKLLFNFTYTDNVFTDNRFVERLLHLSQQVLSGTEKLAALKLQLPDEMQEKNNITTEYKVESVIDLIHMQCEKTPEAIAIIDSTERLTYSNLNAQANQLAHFLREQHQVQHGDNIAIFHSANHQFMVALLASLKLGACYIPVDTNYPVARIQHIINDSSASCIITESCRTSTLADINANKVYLDEVRSSLADYSAENIAHNINVDDKLYLIYTSGSTGIPKAAIVKQRGEINLINWYKKEFKLDINDKILISSAIGFDLTQKNLLAPLCSGSSIVFPEMDDYDPQILVQAIEQHKITLTNCAPSAFYPLVDTDNSYLALASLRLVLFGGEPIRINSLLPWLENPLSHCQLVNMYGPTECTDIAAFYRIDEPGAFKDTPIPIGKANDNVQLFIADSSMRLLPDGFVGELLIAGEGIGAGYLNNPALTASSFIEHPVAGTVYRSGDLARKNANGDFVFINRIDHQVKLRGLRIELGEIEFSLKQLNGVTDALVLVHGKDDQQKLCAYVLTENAEKPEDWRSQLALYLSDYMLPSSLIALIQWPLTANGKIDRKSLPSPLPAGSEKIFVEPRNAIETELLHIWQDVLGQEHISIHDNFFELGGHSLLAARSVTRIREHFQQDLPLRDVFFSPTIASIAQLLTKGLAEGKSASLLPTIEAADRDSYQGLFPLSFTQQRLWLIEQIQQASSMYNIPLALQLEGKVDKDVLINSLQQLFMRHESLHTQITEKDGIAWQKLSTEALVIEQHTLTETESADAITAGFLQQPFMLDNQPLFKAKLLNIREDKSVLLLNMHHIISDGLSSNILLQELAALYQSNAEKSPSPLMPLPLHYIDYSIWQQKYVDHNALQEQIDFWKKTLHQSSLLDLPFDYARSADNAMDGAIIEFTLSASTSKKLIAIAQQENTTLFMVLISAYYVLLNRYSGQSDINIGTAIANRPQQSLESMIGFFVNTLVIRTEIDSDEETSFVQLLAYVKEQCSNAFSHQDLPFERLLDELDVQRDLSHSPLFQTFFTLQNAADISSESIHIHGTEIKAYQAESSVEITTQAKFELSLSMLEISGEISGSFEYRTALFKKETVETLTQHFKQLLDALCEKPTTPVEHISFIDDIEKQQLLSPANNDGDINNSHNVQYLFEQQVALTPNAYAISHGDTSLSYLQLNVRINQLADYLQQEKNISAGKRVAIIQDAGIDFIVCVMATIKCAGCYIPLDCNYPDERIKNILMDAKPDAVLCSQDQLSRLEDLDKGIKSKLVSIHSISSELITRKQENPVNTITNDTSLYIIYTSGSTGKPKGVEIKHQGESNLINWYVDAFNFSTEDRTLIISAIGFDLTQKNFFAPLCSGGSIVFPEDSFYEAEKILALIEQYKVTLLNCAPSALYPLIENNPLSTVRCILLGGESIHKNIIQPWLEGIDYRCELVNMYGPTECTDISTIYRINSADDLLKNNIPIGKAIRGIQTLILDNKQQLLPKGAVGELYIAGIGLSKGYVNNKEQNQQSFIANPYGEGLMYKTCDLVRLQADNNIEYIGRSDHQVKIRGLRIELGEIEQQLQNITGLSQALVMAKDSPQQEKTLIAYYSAQENTPINEAAIRQALSKSLPDYMLPRFYVCITQWPLNANGKIDRKQLPEPQWIQGARSDIVEAKNAIERICVAIWLDVLKLDEVSTTDNFFSIGGHSLKAASVVSLIRKQFTIDISLRDIFDANTIIDLALFIEQQQQKTAIIPQIEKADKNAELSLSYAQQRLWFLAKLDASSPAYNMPAAFRIRGNLNISALEKAFNTIIARHESLRCNFMTDTGEAKLVLHNQKTLDLNTREISSDRALQEAINDDAIAAFDLEKGLLLRAQLLQRDENDFTLLLNMHHIISDGISVQILIRELGTLYMSYAKGGANPLAEMQLHYTDYAQWQRSWLQGDVLEQQLKFWRQALQGAPTLLQLPLDKPRPAVQTFNGAVIKKQITPTLANALRQLSQDSGCTLFMSCLAAYQLLLAKYSQQDDICVGIPLAGRNVDGIDNIIGFFINALIIRSDFSANLSIKELLDNVKNTTLAAFAHEHVPIEMLLNELDIERNLAFTPIAQCAFNMMSASDDVLPDGINDLLDDISIELMASDAVVSKFDLQLNMLDFVENGQQNLSLSMEYNIDIFDAKTIESMLDFYLDILNAFTKNSSASLNSIHLGEFELPDAYEKALPLTAMQRDIYLASLADPDTLENTVGFAWEVTQPINEKLWKQALNDVANQFDVSKADILKNDKPYQDIAYLGIKHKTEVDFISLDWSHGNLSEKEIHARLKTIVSRPIDMTNDAGICYQLIKLTNEHYWATISSHHILIDGFSIVQHLSYLGSRYEQLFNGDSTPLNYKDSFADYCQEKHQAFDSLPTIEYWKNNLSSTVGLHAKTAANKGEGTDVLREVQINDSHSQAIKKYCRQFAINPPLYFKCLYALLIQQYTRAEGDFVLTEFNAGRNKTNKDSLGCFYHTQPFLIEYNSLNSSIENLFKTARDHQKSSRKYLQLSNMKLRQLMPQSDLYFSYNYIMMSHQASLFDKQMGGIRYTPNATSMVDFRVQADGDELSLSIAYNNAIFDDNKLLERCLHLSEQLLTGNIENVAQLNFSLDNETSLTTALMHSDTVTNKPLLTHQAIDLQAVRTPDAIAVRCGDEQLTYQQLQLRSNHLAQTLIDSGIEKGSRIAICLSRRTELLTTLLASMKAGACYVPLDPAYPEERLQYIIDDAQASLIITETRQAARFKSTSKSIINVDNIDTTQTCKRPPQIDIQPIDSLYMIYTSGSTGQPKGATVLHQGECNLLDWYCKEFDFKACDKTLIISAVGFDLTQKNFFALLTVGGTVVLPHTNEFDVNAFIKIIRDEKISLINCAPSAFYALTESDLSLGDLSSLRQIFFGGEPIQIHRLENFIHSENYQADIINMYGPTECTDISSYHVLNKDDALALLAEPVNNAIPLGRANTGVKLYVLNEKLQQLPEGLTGELCIAGMSVGAGYWNKPKLSADAFIENPYSCDDADKILYRTGDLVRAEQYNNETVLYYIGRKDFQVKIRGQRIELGEIEQQVKTLATVTDCQVLVDDESILAFVLSDTSAEIESWREILAQTLPDYMLPSQIITLQAWPLTPNGKVDRNKLLELERPAQNELVQYVAPRTEMEKNLANLWQEVLGLGDMGVHENFFEAGGDSLSAVRLIARIELRFEVKLPVASLFGAQTIAQLAHVIHNQNSDWSPIVPIQPQGIKTPIFAIHALGAMVLSYEPLARSLGKDQPFYGIQAYGFEDEQTPFTDMNEMVTFYVSAIKEQQAQGPYQLLGHSFGGLIALEIARVLMNEGYEVSYLGLIDTHKPAKYMNMPLDDAFILKTFAEHNFGVVDIPLNALRVMKPDTMIHKVAQRFNGMVSEDFIRSAITVIRGFQRMSMNYKPGNIKLNIHLYRPEQTAQGLGSTLKKMIFRNNAETLGWHKVATSLSVSQVKGDHHSLLNNDHVASMADELSLHLDQVKNKALNEQ